MSGLHPDLEIQNSDNNGFFKVHYYYAADYISLAFLDVLVMSCNAK